MTCDTGIPCMNRSRAQMGMQSGPHLRLKVTGYLHVGPKCVAQHRQQ